MTAPQRHDDVTCAEFVEQLTALLDGALDAATRQRALDHLRGCAGCEEYFDQYRRVVGGLGALREPAPDRLLHSSRAALLATLRARRVTGRGSE